jgi:hypothetical protein
MNKADFSTRPHSECLDEETSILEPVDVGHVPTPERACSEEPGFSRQVNRGGSGKRNSGRLAASFAAHSKPRNPGPRCKHMTSPASICLLLVVVTLVAVSAQAGEEPEQAGVCRPILAKAPALQLSQSGVFRWSCSAQGRRGESYYIVFVRPSGTYVLLKVPDGRTEFEFTPDVEGQWRWIVINTDPDRTKPDVESEPGSFSVTPVPGSSP